MWKVLLTFKYTYHQKLSLLLIYLSLLDFDLYNDILEFCIDLILSL